MAVAIPTQVPTRFTAGDTVSWKITLADFPASSGWTLSYALLKRGGAELISITSTASGDDHLVSVTPAVSGAYIAGDYEWQAYVTDGTDRYKVGEGRICVEPNLAQSQGTDTRSNARKILDALEAAILKVSQSQASGASGRASEWQVEGLRIKRSSPEALLLELTKQRDRYAAICANEDARAAVRAGRATGRRILVQFTG